MGRGREIPSQEGRVTGENNRCDLEIHCSDADTRPAQPLELGTSSVIEIDNEDISIAAQMRL
jgi:hypothetical protein